MSMNFNKLIEHYLNEDKVSGGKADKATVKSIAKKGLKETMSVASAFGNDPNIGSRGGDFGNKDWYAPKDARIPKVLGKGGVLTRHGLIKKKKKNVKK